MYQHSLKWQVFDESIFHGDSGAELGAFEALSCCTRFAPSADVVPCAIRVFKKVPPSSELHDLTPSKFEGSPGGGGSGPQMF